MDENVDPLYQKQLRRLNPDLVVWAVGDPGAPAKGTLDPEILHWCEEHTFILVTNNRASMPLHLADHIAHDRHIPGIFILSSDLSVGQSLDELQLIAEASLEGEYQDQMIYLPTLR
ncbi:MAG: DUF5615 family PIN-like protein [Tildeniella nuda ZEHNDER 1965/U140]|nr:DUF5615 family PIN-like protein [Tildeniella nuda ZEHNDER 1965/U140]